MAKQSKKDKKEIDKVKREVAELAKDKYAEASKIADSMEFDNLIDKGVYTSKLAQKMAVEQYENSRKNRLSNYSYGLYWHR